MSGAEVAVATACHLGEAPTWDSERQRLLWLDIEAGVLHELDHRGRHTSVELAQPATCVVPGSAGGLIAAANLSVHHLDENGSTGSIIARLPSGGNGRTNDGRCDIDGALWIGTVDMAGAERGGALFRVSADGTVATMKSGVSMSNGIDWSPDGRRCYHVDSGTRRVETTTLDRDGQPTGWTSFVETESIPDGLTVDADGCIWVALWDGGGIRRYMPDGRLDRSVEVPGGFVTSCAFGGPSLKTLFVTTARIGLGEADLVANPDAGALFALDVDVPGCGYTPFALSGALADSRLATGCNEGLRRT